LRHRISPEQKEGFMPPDLQPARASARRRILAGLAVAAAVSALAPAAARADLPYNAAAARAPNSTDQFQLGSYICDPANRRMFVFAPRQPLGGAAEWFAVYSTIAKWNGSAYVPNTSLWKGPVYGHTSHPGWFWTEATGWKNANQNVWSLGWAQFDIPASSGYYRAYQWIKRLTTGTTYAGTVRDQTHCAPS
jgi:hypothetical protein